MTNAGRIQIIDSQVSNLRAQVSMIEAAHDDGKNGEFKKDLECA